MLDFDNLFNFDDLFNSFDWDKKNYKFNRDEKDMHPYSIIDNEKEVIIVHNVLGIDKKDLKISLNKENGNTYILIEGKSIDELTKKEYSISSKFAIDATQYKKYFFNNEKWTFIYCNTIKKRRKIKRKYTNRYYIK